MKFDQLSTCIEQKLGNFKRLPNFPFEKEGAFALFPGSEFSCINECLYRALFKANIEVGNECFLATAHLYSKNEGISFIKQKKPDWDSFNGFQQLPLAYEGFYITGELLNWLGIYHFDDYIIVGGNDKFINIVCDEIYGNNDWLSPFESAFEEGMMSVYQDDFDALKDGLLKNNR